MFLRRFQAVAIAVVLVGGGGAWRAAAEPQAPDPAAEFARIDAAAPPDAEIVITLHAGSKARRSPAGRAAAALVEELVTGAETGRTWSELAGVLGWTPDECFDQLIGRHVMLLVKGEMGRGAAWAIVGAVSAEAEARMRERLNPVPRAIVGGTTVLAIESGKYRMAIWGPRAAPGDSTFVLAPADAPLFEEMIRRLTGHGAGARPSAATRPYASVLIRRPPGAGGPPFTLTLTAAVDASGVEMDMRLACTGVSDPGLDLVTPWSDAAIRALSDDAFLATMGVVGLSPFESAADVIGIPRVDLGGAGMDRLLGQRVALIVRESPAGQLAPAPMPAGGAQAGERGFEGVLAAAGAARRPLSITLALETLDLGTTMPRADALAARFTQPPGAAGVELIAFEAGATPVEVREVPLSAPVARDWAGVIGDEPVLRWAYARDAGGRAPKPGSGGERGWWIVGLAPDGAPKPRGVESVRAALVRSAADPSDVRRISAGFIRPRAIERWAVGVDAKFAPFVRALRRVESARWDAWLGADGGIEGRATIRWDPPPR